MSFDGKEIGFKIEGGSIIGYITLQDGFVIQLVASVGSVKKSDSPGASGKPRYFVKTGFMTSVLTPQEYEDIKRRNATP